MEELNIRKATESDLPTLRKFEQGVISAERPFDPTLKKDPINYYDLNEFLASPNIHLVVAEYDSQLVGCGYARIEKAKHFIRHDQHAYLGFMYTVPEFRGKGVNQKIIEELKRWAISMGIAEMQLEVYSENAPAIKAYEKAGFSRHLITMRMAIE